jgi:hypothetical protein
MNTNTGKLLLALALQETPLQLARHIVRGLREASQDINCRDERQRWALIQLTLAPEVATALQLFGFEIASLTEVTFSTPAYREILEGAKALRYAAFTKASRESLLQLLTADHVTTQTHLEEETAS